MENGEKTSMYEHFIAAVCGALLGLILVYVTWLWQTHSGSKVTYPALSKYERKMRKITGTMILLFGLIFIVSLYVCGAASAISVDGS